MNCALRVVAFVAGAVAGAGAAAMVGLHAVLAPLYSPPVYPPEVHRIMRCIDNDKSGTMCFREFLAMMRRPALPSLARGSWDQRRRGKTLVSMASL